MIIIYSIELNNQIIGFIYCMFDKLMSQEYRTVKFTIDNSCLSLQNISEYCLELYNSDNIHFVCEQDS